FTARASLETPRQAEARASSSNAICFGFFLAIGIERPVSTDQRVQCFEPRGRARPPRPTQTATPTPQANEVPRLKRRSHKNLESGRSREGCQFGRARSAAPRLSARVTPRGTRAPARRTALLAPLLAGDRLAERGMRKPSRSKIGRASCRERGENEVVDGAGGDRQRKITW